MRPSTEHCHDTSELRPERALLTPTWLGALALLVANDHWLKGADLIPGALTGKLSDFAGLLVAPVLMASLLRVRTRRGLLACHLAVVAVFAGIQLSAGFAGLWSGVMGLVGHPWMITCDPTDLIALPFAWLSWRLLTPAMSAERPALIGLQRSAVAAVSVFGLWATVATSDDDGHYDDCPGCWDDTSTSGWGDDSGDGDGDAWLPVEGSVYVHNPNTFDIAITIRPLSIEVLIDCEALAKDPGRLLPDDAFGPAEHWLLPPTTNVGVGMVHGCGAAKIGGEGIPEQIVFSTNLNNWQTFPGSHEDIDALGPLGAAIVMGPEGGEWIGGQDWRHTPTTDVAPLPETCLPAPAERRIAWSELPGEIVVEVLSIEVGLDGCHELELLPWAGENYGQVFDWYLCAPEPSIRLEPGAYYRIVSSQEPSPFVEARLVDPVTHMNLEDDEGRGLFTARWSRGLPDASWIPGVIEATAIEALECPWVVGEGCPIVERKLGLSLGLPTIEVEPGVPAIHHDALGFRHELTLSRARALALVDGSCATGSVELPHDIDYALISEPQNP